MGHFKEDPVSIPFFSEELVNTNDAIVKRVNAEHGYLIQALAKAEMRYRELVNSYNATFTYRVGMILADPEVVLPQLPQWNSEIAE